MANPYQSPSYEAGPDTLPKVRIADLQRQYSTCLTPALLLPPAAISVAYGVDMILKQDVRGFCIFFSNCILVSVIFQSRVGVFVKDGRWENYIRPLPALPIGVAGIFVLLPVVLAYVTLIRHGQILNVSDIVHPIFLMHTLVTIFVLSVSCVVETVFRVVYFVCRDNTK